MSDTRLSQLQKMLEINSKDSFLLFAIAKEHEGMGQNNEALDFYLKLKENDPAYVGLYYHLGKLYEILEQANTAWKTYCTGMEVAQKAGDQHAYNELAGAKMELGDEDDFS